MKMQINNAIDLLFEREIRDIAILSIFSPKEAEKTGMEKQASMDCTRPAPRRVFSVVSIDPYTKSRCIENKPGK